MILFNLILLLVSINEISAAVLSWSTFINEAALEARLKYELVRLDKTSVPVNKRYLVVYHLGQLTDVESLDVAENNVKLFSAAVMAHKGATQHKAFYIFRVEGGKKNKLARHLPTGTSNVAFCKSPHNTRELLTQIHTINVLGAQIVSQFHSVLFLTHDVRGPFVDRADGEWWGRINHIFTTYPKVGMVGATISCESSPHVQAHALAMRSPAALQIFAAFKNHTSPGSPPYPGNLEVSLSTTAMALGYQISSLAYERHYGEPVYVGRCVAAHGNYPIYDANPTSWCDIKPEEALFMKWGGAPLSLRGYYCQQTIDAIHQATLKIAESEHALHLTLPETISGGNFFALTKEYDLEHWKDKSLPRVKFNALVQSGEMPQKVCFLVRSAMSQGRNAARSSHLVNMDLPLFITSKILQL